MTDLVLSSSQAETYDLEQSGGCPRRWWFERVERRERAADSASAEDGIAGHALFAAYLRGQALPKRARMLKAVRGAVHHLPEPRPGLLVESRFDMQVPSDRQQSSGVRGPLRTETTLWLGGVPWDGYVDLRWRDGDAVTVWDHKFSSDIDTYAKPADKLIRTVQMPVYALDSLRLWPDAKQFRLVHLYVSRRGVYSFVREQTVTRSELDARAGEIAALVARIQRTAAAKTQDEVEANRKACHTYGGCPHQSVCTAFRRKPMYELTEEERALFGPVAEVTGEKAKSAEMSPVVQELIDTPPDVLAAAVENLSSAERERLKALTEIRVPDVSIPLPQASTLTPQAENGAPGTFTNPLVQNSAGVAVPMCQDCPHAAHPGSQCSGKRGRGQCRCGAASAAPVPSARPPQGTAHDPDDHGWTPHDDAQTIGYQRVIAGHLPTCVQSDGGKWLCMDGCAAGRSIVDALEEAQAAGVRHAQEKFGPGGPEDLTKPDPTAPRTIPEVVGERLDRALAKPTPPALRLEVEFGPRAAAILEKLAPALIELLKAR